MENEVLDSDLEAREVKYTDVIIKRAPNVGVLRIIAGLLLALNGFLKLSGVISNSGSLGIFMAFIGIMVFIMGIWDMSNYFYKAEGNLLEFKLTMIIKKEINRNDIKSIEKKGKRIFIHLKNGKVQRIPFTLALASERDLFLKSLGIATTS